MEQLDRKAERTAPTIDPKKAELTSFPIFHTKYRLGYNKYKSFFQLFSSLNLMFSKKMF